jgi:uncharacterized membrane protein
LKKKLLTTLVAISILVTTFAPSVKAASINIYGYTNKSQYAPGEKGTLRIVIYNSGTESVILESVTIEYPWYWLYIWEGNETIANITTAIPAKGNWSVEKPFTIPADGRAVGGNIRINAYTDEGTIPDNVAISVADSSTASTMKYMEQVSLLFTLLVLIVLIGICVVAATIFLSARRAQVMWKTEEKPE